MSRLRFKSTWFLVANLLVDSSGFAAWSISTPTVNTNFSVSGDISGTGSAGDPDTAFVIYVVEIDGPLETVHGSASGTSTSGSSPTWSETATHRGDWPVLTELEGRFRLAVTGEETETVNISIGQ